MRLDENVVLVVDFVVVVASWMMIDGWDDDGMFHV